MFASLVSRALRLLCYPHLVERLPGPHPVGVRRVRIPGSVACQLLYPAATAVGRRAPYWRPEAVEGLAEYSQLPEALFRSVLTLAHHPCAEAPAPLESSEEGWPLVVFSHGLGGCEEMYSQLCAFIASHGYVVFVPEHEDGSGCHATTADGEHVRFRRPPPGLVAQGKAANVEFRAPFLAKRVDEICAALAYLLSPSPGGALADVLATLDKAAGAQLIAHSFGCASAVLAAQNGGSGVLPAPISSVVLLDPWVFPLRDEVLRQGVVQVRSQRPIPHQPPPNPRTSPCPSEPPPTSPRLLTRGAVRAQPTLCVLSEAWTRSAELRSVRTLLEASSEVATLWAPGTRHQSVADTATWAPSLLVRKAGALGTAEKMHTTRIATAAACHGHMRSSLATETPLMTAAGLASAALHVYKFGGTSGAPARAAHC